MRDRALFLAVLCCTSTACGGARRVVQYDVSLKEVTRPASARQQYGDQVVTRISPAGTRIDSLKRTDSFEDGLVKVTWGVSERSAYLTLENKTPHSVAVLWDRAAMVMPDGRTSAVMHNGVRYSDCSAPKTPSVVVSQSLISETVIPCSTVALNYASWEWYIFETNPLSANNRKFFGGRGVAFVDPVKLAPKLNERDQNARFRILLPLEIQGVVNEYTFSFAVDSVYLMTLPKK